LILAAGCSSYPYGKTHACSKNLGLVLRLNAEDHDGWLPYGEATPEESLGKLANEDPSCIPLLGGKNVPPEKVKAALEPGGHFSAQTCGWHYIEGLRVDENLQIAVAWDKTVGLNHFGERDSAIMHEIIRLDGTTAYISKKQWPEFMSMEKKVLEEIIAKRETNAPKIRWSDVASLGPNRFPAATK
jgi:hypothetical protein